MRRYGGCVVQAHPFRNSTYIDCIYLSPECVDAVEVANAGNYRPDDAIAWAYAEKIKVTATAGSDIHHVDDTNISTFGVYLNKKMKTIGDYVKAVRNNTITGLKIPSNRCELKGNENLSMAVCIRDSQDKETEITLYELLDINK